MNKLPIVSRFQPVTPSLKPKKWILPQYKPDWEMFKANYPYKCWGAEVKVKEGWLSCHQNGCQGMINKGTFYLRRPDRRDARVYWKLSIECALAAHAEKFDDEVRMWYMEITDERVADVISSLVAMDWDF